MDDRFSLTSFPDYYQDSDLPGVLTKRIKEKIRVLSTHFPTETRKDILRIISKAVELSNLELDAAIGGVWVPQVVAYVNEMAQGIDSIQLDIRSFCRIGAGLN
jgi:hypothetical protein